MSLFPISRTQRQGWRAEMATDAQTFEKIKRLLRHAEGLSGFWGRYREKISEQSCDKHRAGCKHLG